MRLRGALAAFLIFPLIALLVVQMGDTAGDVTSPSLEDGASFTWSYDFRSEDGGTTRSGIMTAGVNQLSWKGFDCFMFSGTIDGQFTTPEGSGDEAGTFSEYYRTIDLALLDSSQDIEVTISGYDTLNMTDVSYSPGFEWIKFPLAYTPAQWNVDGQDIHTSWEVHIDGEPSYSGNQDDTVDITFFVTNTGSAESVNVEAGTFDTYHIRESWIDDPDGKTVETYYSDEVGWWVQRDVLIDGDTEKIILRHWELKEWGSNDPPVSEPIPDITIDEDAEDSSIVLDEVFSDPDGDDLVYGVEDNGSLPVSISSGRIVIAPAENEFGSWSFNVTAGDSIYPPVSSQVNVTVRSVDDPPILSDPQFNPGTGDPDTEFSFSIHLADVEGDSPSSAVLHLTDTTRDLLVISGSPADDLILGWSGILPVGSYEHYYTVDGVRYPETGAISGPVVSSTAVPELSSGSVDPSEGGLDTEFTFTVIWEFEDGEEPDQINLVLDGFDHPMEKLSGTPAAGSTYSVTTTLTAVDHSHHYEAVLGGDSFRYPVSEISGPEVFEPEIIELGAYETDDGVVFYCIVEYDLGIDPDGVDLLISGDRYPVTSEEGSISSGLNLSASRDLDPGTYDYSFEITFGDRVYETDEGTIDIEEEVVVDDDDDSDDDDPVDPGTSDDGSSNTLLIAVAIIAGAVLIAAVIFVLGRRPKEPSGESWDEEEELDAEEGQSSRVRGI